MRGVHLRGSIALCRLRSTSGPLLLLLTAFLLLGIAATIFMIVNELNKPNRALPKVLYYVLVLSAPIFVYFADWIALAFFFAARIVHHWMVAIGLFSRVNINWYRREKKSFRKAAVSYLLRFVPFVVVALADQPAEDT